VPRLHSTRVKEWATKPQLSDLLNVWPLDIKLEVRIYLLDNPLHWCKLYFEKKTIAFIEVKYPHSGLAIEEAITRCPIAWGIKGKVFTITLDNAFNNMSTCDLLWENGGFDMSFADEHLHVRCCAHILNILVQDGLAVAHRAIDKILRELDKQINSSPSRMQAFNGIVKR
jgi:hypothetical protein